MVNTDRVGADGLHEGRVETTLCRVDEGIVGYQLVGDTCRLWSVAVLVSRAGVRTLDEELVAILGEKLGALDGDGIDSVGRGYQGRGKQDRQHGEDTRK